MLFEVYKPKQGVRARLVVLGAAAVIAVFGGRWLYGELIQKPAAWSYGVSFGVGLVVLGVAAWLANLPRLVDLLIETESELKKVSWSSRKDLWKSTWVVIVTILIMGVFMFTVVKVVEQVFFRTGVLLRTSESEREARSAEPWPWAAGDALARGRAAPPDDAGATDT